MSESLESRLKRAKSAIKEADHILIGGGAGLSAAAGLTYSGKRFTDNFGDFIVRYDMSDMYSAGFYPFETPEEKWAYWSRHIHMNRYEPPALKLYLDLQKLISGKDYFVITTNVDQQFYKAGFDKDRIFDTQGDYGKFQCAVGCHDTLYDNEQAVRSMVAQQRDCRIPSTLIPKCPVCGGDMDMNLRKDGYFVQDAEWYKRSAAFESYLHLIAGNRIVLMEFGVGYNTPTIIRFPFEQITYKEPKATLIRFNRDYPEAIKENQTKTISFSEDISLLFNNA